MINSYFTPYRIDGVGTFQDGGLTFNNPTSIGVKEASALFPAAGKPSIVASFGTGFERRRHDSGARFPVRLFQAACKQMVQRQEVDERGEVFRFDVEFDGRQPPLDDVSHMDETARLAREATLGSAAMQQLARRIRAELFLFELDPARPPRFANGAYDCFGRISCRLRAGTVGLAAFMGQLHRSGALFRCHGRSLPSSFRDGDGIAPDGNFCQEVTFHVAGRRDPFDIQLCEAPGDPDTTACNIGGSPFTVDWLTRQQGLEAWFGARSDHRKRPRLDVAGVPRVKRRKLSGQFR